MRFLGDGIIGGLGWGKCSRVRVTVDRKLVGSGLGAPILRGRDRFDLDLGFAQVGARWWRGFGFSFIAGWVSFI